MAKRTLKNITALLEQKIIMERFTEDSYRKDMDYTKAEQHKHIRWELEDIYDLLTDAKYFNDIYDVYKNRIEQRNAD